LKKEIEEMQALSPVEIKKKINEAGEELFNLRFRLSTRQLVNHREIPRVRRHIARLNTILRAKELSGPKSENPG
jgi:large subunit ribosomal protein L29